MKKNLFALSQIVAVLVFTSSFGSLSLASSSIEAVIKSEASTAFLMNQIGMNPTTELPNIPAISEELSGGRLLSAFRLPAPSGTVDLLVSRPLKAYNLPVLFIAAGFQTGKDVATLIPNPGNNVIVGYQYPLRVDTQRIPQPQEVIDALRGTSAQIALSLRWVQKQTWCDPARVNVLGVSLGTLFLPSALQIASKLGFINRHAIFAYGGADVSLLLPREWPSRVTPAVKFLLTPLEPITHLPFLDGDFLVIRGTQDEVFPQAAQNALIDNLPNREVFSIVGPHISADKPELIVQTATKIGQWLSSSNSLNR
jgi:hypothetical protein